MKRFAKILLALGLAVTAAFGALVTSCDDPVEVIVTDYGYTVTLDDIHMAEGVYPECIVKLTSGGDRSESVTLNYLIDDDASLRVRVNGEEVRPGSDVAFDLGGTLRIVLPSLKEGEHRLHLVLTNRYNKSVSRDLTFAVIRDKVWAKGISAPERLRLEKGSVKDTTAVITPEDADILVLSASSSDSTVAVASILGAGAQKVLRVDPVGDGTARISVIHEDLPKPAVVTVEVYSYKIGGLNDITVEEGKDVTFTLTVEPEHDVTLSSSNANATVQDMGNRTFKVTGVTPGSAILTAAAGNTRQEAVVTVRKKEETIAVSPMSAVIAYGATKVFSVASSAEYRAELSNDNATVVEMTTSGVSVKNENRSFTDGEVTLTVINRADENKKATSSIVLEKKPETVSLAESSSSEGRLVLSVAGENGGWELVSAPDGVKASVDGGDIILVNDSYKTITGKVAVRTKLQEVTASKEVSVRGLAVTLSSLLLDPSEFSVEVGRSLSAAVTGVYVDGSRQDVTGAVTWTQSSNLQRNGNSFAATATGQAWIRASLEGKSVQADGRVTMTVTDLAIEPTYFSALVGENKLFTVTAKYSDGSSKDVTRDCRYEITGGAKEVAKGYVAMTEPGEVLVEAIYTYDGKESYATARGSVTKPVANVVRVAVTPVQAQCKVGESVSFTGTVYFSDGTQDNTSGSWSVSDPSVLSGGSGTYIALKEGNATVMYTCGEYSATASVVVQGGGGSGGGDLSGIVLSKTTMELAPGKVEQVTVVASYTDGSVKDVTREVKWNVVNTKVASVDQYGYVMALAEGETYITAEWSTKVVQLYVMVRTPVTLKSLAADPSSLAFALYGAAQQVKLTASYSDGSEETVTGQAQWSSSDSQVATVQAGLVTPVKKGTCNVSATFGGKTTSVPVTVGDAEIGKIEILPSAYYDYTCTVGDTYELECIGRYKGAEMTITYVTWAATWTASPSGVVSIEDSATKKRIRAIGAGDATITAEYAGLRASVKVHVKAAAPTVTGIVLNPSSISLKSGGTYDLSSVGATYKMSDGSTGSTASISWSLPTSSKSYATLNGTTLKVKDGVANDTSFKVQAKTSDGKYTADLSVTVSAANWVFDRLETNSNACVIVVVGSTVTITDQVNIYAVYKDKNGKESEKSEKVSDKVTWTALCKDGEFTVNENQLTGIKKCDASANTGVRALYRSGNDEGSVNIPVQVSSNPNAVTSVTLNKTSMPLIVGNTETLTATVYPNTANQEIEWSSTSTSVATVKDGEVTAQAVGKATIRATSKEDKSKYAECMVTVSAAPVPVTGVSIVLDDDSAISNPFECNVNNSYKLKAQVTGKGGNAPTIDSYEWSSSQVLIKLNPDDAAATTMSCTEVRSGTVTLKVKDYAGTEKTATINVKFVTPEYDILVYSDQQLTQKVENLEWTYTEDGSKTLYVKRVNVSYYTVTCPNVFKYSRDDDVITIHPDGKNNGTDDRIGKLILESSDGTKVKREIPLVQYCKPAAQLTTIDLAASSTTMAGNNEGIVRFTATPKDQEGNVMSGQQLVWHSSDNSLTFTDVSGAPYMKDAKSASNEARNVKVWVSCGDVKSEEVEITVTSANISVTGVSLSEPSIEIKKGDTYQLTAQVKPDNASDKTVTWDSDNTSIASVDDNGLVTGLGSGVCNISVITNDGRKKAVCQVTVRSYVTDITVSPSSFTLSAESSTKDIKVVVEPADADVLDCAVDFNSNVFNVVLGKNIIGSNEFNYTVSLVSSAIEAGDYVVKFKAKDGSNVEGLANIKVVIADPVVNADITGTTSYTVGTECRVSLDNTGVDLKSDILGNSSGPLSKYIDKLISASYSASVEFVPDEHVKVEKLSSGFVLRGVMAGKGKVIVKVILTPTAINVFGSKIEVICPTPIVVDVYQSVVKSVNLSPASGPVSLIVGESKTYSVVSIKNERNDIMYGTVTWSCDNTSIVDVSYEGNNATLTGKKAGSTIVRATYQGVSAVISANVSDSDGIGDIVSISARSSSFTAQLGSSIDIAPLIVVGTAGNTTWDATTAGNEGVSILFNGNTTRGTTLKIPNDTPMDGMATKTFECGIMIGTKKYGSFTLRVTNY